MAGVVGGRGRVPPRVKTPEEKWGAVLEGSLRMHGCVDAIGLPPVYAALVTTPKGGERK